MPQPHLRLVKVNEHWQKCEKRQDRIKNVNEVVLYFMLYAFSRREGMSHCAGIAANSSIWLKQAIAQKPSEFSC